MNLPGKIRDRMKQEFKGCNKRMKKMIREGKKKIEEDWEIVELKV